MLRRAFLLGLLTAPAFVRASSLDYVPRGLILPESLKWSRSVVTTWNYYVTYDEDGGFVVREFF